MAEAVTLELSDDVARHARETARRTGRQLEDVLTDWIKRGAANDASTQIVLGAEYPIYTPYGNEKAAQVLLDALHSDGPQTITCNGRRAVVVVSSDEWERKTKRKSNLAE